jgi:hypothetical protein
VECHNRSLLVPAFITNLFNCIQSKSCRLCVPIEFIYFNTVASDSVSLMPKRGRDSRLTKGRNGDMTTYVSCCFEKKALRRKKKSIAEGHSTEELFKAIVGVSI